MKYFHLVHLFVVSRALYDSHGRWRKLVPLRLRPRLRAYHLRLCSLAFEEALL